ncbi:MAG: metalloregulator ArsR/SmtB family transcription factor [Desulfobacterales bacterium]|jgi:ubiquinone/menaquinone biosynthesis C-methylase UbiE/DNA-binding transcriptional ArsR family regulator|nr:metalloregulator ArsR/SmtB family transcription factor [Desulfobacteraceae bacterium]MBT4363202.1 metalloregulator ArsR/SmtB family transcription factor [Desulfobacteraceae bacterium]MBT7084720.1 metalloregulator ArsR/SmtB family transcription factor [Desulfobacterales bacterium]
MDSIIYFKALSDITRIRLFNILLHHELSVNEIVSLMDMGQSRISRHLKILVDAELLKCRRDGVWAFYSCVDVGPGREFVDSIKYLFDSEYDLNKDVVKARKIVDKRKLATMQFFNRVANEWDLLQREVLGGFDLNDKIVKHIGKCNVAVDLGCGTGELLSYIRECSTRVVGVDSSAKMLDITKKRFRNDIDSIDLRLGEIEHLPLGNEEADCVVISMVLHHLSEPDMAIKEVHRILKPGGIFIIADFDKHKDEEMRHSYNDRWLGFAKKEMELWLKENNFSLEKSEKHKLKQSLELSIYKSVKER